jgi:dipeptidyl aminopeptidase/acylaminoacyl peptidase
LWLLELGSGISTRATFGGFNSDAVWSPEGRQLIYTWFNGPVGDLYRAVIGRGGSELLFKSAESKYAQLWSKDNASILFIDEGGRSLYRLPLSGEGKPEILLRTPFDKDEFRVSPDGRWIAYNSLESGRWDVYVASFPSFAEKRQISTGGGCQPTWRRDGRELYYLGLQGELMSLEVVTGSSFEAGVPRLLFQTPITVNPVIDQYAVTGDGQRFIMGTPVGEEEPITVILNWTAGLTVEASKR